MKKRKKIRRTWVVAAIILMIVLVAMAALYLWQQENIKAAANARKYTESELKQQLEENRATIQAAVEQHPEITVRNLTEDERAALRSGNISAEELVKQLIRPEKEKTEFPGAFSPPEQPPAATEPIPSGVTVSAPPVSTEKPAESAMPAPEETPDQPTQQELYEQQLSEQVAKVYVMREQYTATLDSMMAQAKAEYQAMPESERTQSNLASWASGYISRASDLEKQCDAEMDAILAEMNSIIKANGGDTAIIKTMAYAYAEEKSIQKSIYIQELEKRGIL